MSGDPEREGQAYWLTGPEVLTLTQQVEAIPEQGTLCHQGGRASFHLTPVIDHRAAQLDTEGAQAWRGRALG